MFLCTVTFSFCFLQTKISESATVTANIDDIDEDKAVLMNSLLAVVLLLFVYISPRPSFCPALHCIAIVAHRSKWVGCCCVLLL